MSKIEIEISGNSDELRYEIQAAKKDLKDLEKQKVDKIRLGVDSSDLDKKLADAKAKLATLDTQLHKTTQATQNFSKATANGGNTLTQFSRIAQDAPFGIIGIGNNLTATAEAFGNLSRSSGGATNALKAVGASLLGSGGVLLAISLVTTGLTYMAQSGVTVSDVFQKLSGTFNQTANELKKASEEGTKSAQEEISVLKALVFTAKNEELSRKERLIAVQKLQKEYPAYFGNLSQEEILYGNLSKVIKDVSQALVDKAVADKLATKAGNAQYRLLELNFKLIQAKEDIVKAEQAYYKAAREGSAATESLSLAIDKSKNRLQEVRNEYIKTKNELEAYQNVLNKKYSSSILTQASAPKANKVAKQGNTNEPIIRFRSELKPITADQLKPINNSINEALNFEFAQALQFPLTEQFANMQALTAEFVNNFNELVSSAVVSGLGDLGTSIGEALATGGNVLQAAGNSLLQTFSSFLGSLGDQLIALGTAAVLTGTVLKSLGSISGIGAGLAAIAGGVLVKGIAGAMGASARKGINGGSASTNSGNNSYTPSSTISTGSNGGFGNGRVVFEISGNSLIGVLSNALDKNSRLGGTLGIN